jgi:hypothetical protein
MILIVWFNGLASVPCLVPKTYLKSGKISCPKENTVSILSLINILSSFFRGAMDRGRAQNVSSWSGEAWEG